MRERKFRAWDKERKEMGTVINLNTNYCDARLENEDYGVWAANIVSVMESTSKKDLDDKEIYEGDIVTFLDSTEFRYLRGKYQFWNVGEVFWNESRVGFDVSNRRSISIDDVWENVRVLGNIFESPEVLSEYEMPQY